MQNRKLWPFFLCSTVRWVFYIIHKYRFSVSTYLLFIAWYFISYKFELTIDTGNIVREGRCHLFLMVLHGIWKTSGIQYTPINKYTLNFTSGQNFNFVWLDQNTVLMETIFCIYIKQMRAFHFWHQYVLSISSILKILSWAITENTHSIVTTLGSQIINWTCSSFIQS